MNLLKVFGACLGGALAGALVGEAFITYKEYKKMRNDYPDMKTMDAIKQAAKERVEEIKRDPRAEVTALWTTVASAFMYCMGIKLGDKIGYDRGVYDGAGKGIDSFIQALKKNVPDEFKKFISIIDRKGVRDINAYREFFKVGRAKYERGYTWVPGSCKFDDDSTGEIKHAEF